MSNPKSFLRHAVFDLVVLAVCLGATVGCETAYRAAKWRFSKKYRGEIAEQLGRGEREARKEAESIRE